MLQALQLRALNHLKTRPLPFGTVVAQLASGQLAGAGQLSSADAYGEGVAKEVGALTAELEEFDRLETPVKDTKRAAPAPPDGLSEALVCIGAAGIPVGLKTAKKAKKAPSASPAQPSTSAGS
eukprot:10275764-Alexandrium_andersonii.AAC.1